MCALWTASGFPVIRSCVETLLTELEEGGWTACAVVSTPSCEVLVLELYMFVNMFMIHILP